MGAEQRPGAPVRQGVAVAAALTVVVVALNLRASIAVVPPVLGEVQQAHGLSLTAAGLLTTLPLLCFGLVAPVAGWLGNRWRLEPVLAGAMLTLALGLVGRSYAGTPGLFAGSLVVGAAITVGNVLVPGMVKRDFRTTSSMMTAVYVTTFTGGAAVAAGVSIPLAGWSDLGWQGALSVWALPAVVAAALLVVRARRGGRALPPSAAPGATTEQLPPVSVWRSPVAWLITGYTGLQSLLFYAGLTWLPTILVDAGLTRRDAALALVLYTIVGVPVSLLVPFLARGTDHRLPLVLPGPFVVVGLVGLGAWPQQWLLWTVVMAVALGWGLSIGLSQVVLRAGSPAVAARLSAMSQFAGYLLTACGTWAAGATAEATDGWTLSLAGLVAVVVAMLGCGLLAGRPTATVRGRGPAAPSVPMQEPLRPLP
ncbi:MFS transporter [Blastococcus sp. CT_GayMR20]|uniref:MFS transporter n=1 Tax=Blastococcus sp. CT_GayMR20 TaxID=2559609 RepID=UPI00107477AE|nr:MFS transporter [Blastococcus sp. CT_GayMR20]TFV90247.1 MFS transporter [Blastococcus sp. CT_GayMR20]